MQFSNFFFQICCVESTEYEMITGFLQGFVDNEINLNEENTCKKTCEDYRLTRQYGCHNDTLCGVPLKNQRINKCNGILRDCEFIGSDLEICPSVSIYGIINKSILYGMMYMYIFCILCVECRHETL